MGVMEKWETLISNKTLAPSLLAADFTRLGEEAGIVERAGVEGLPVHMENDIHYKAYGYYKKEGRENDIVTLCFFPANVLPGTAMMVYVSVGTLL